MQDTWKLEAKIYHLKTELERLDRELTRIGKAYKCLKTALNSDKIRVNQEILSIIKQNNP